MSEDSPLRPYADDIYTCNRTRCGACREECPIYRIRGGSYDSVAAGLSCTFDFVSARETYFYGNLGFRCCSDAAP